MRGTFHLLTQYAWPDDAPTGIYAEHVADGLASRGVAVALVTGGGSYRSGRRVAPATPIRRLSHRQGRRGKLLSTAREYRSVDRAFGRYIAAEVKPGDFVLVTSAPPTTLFLHQRIRQRGARAFYWLQDYYPQLIRGVWDGPAPLLRSLRALWTRSLERWEVVLKSASNLGYHSGNSQVFRNWNTVEPGVPRPYRPRTALYSGNLGYGHDIGSFVEMCERLRGEGYDLTIRGDGPGMRQLPAWLRPEPPLASAQALLASYWDSEVHLVAADPRLQDAIFPSKLWNALAVGRRIEASGFAGDMAEELAAALASDFRRHRDDLIEFLFKQFGNCRKES